jgi:hypothetical protein
MGQYRLWLHYWEVDRQLHSELELLEQKLATLQEQAGRLQEVAAPTDNVIIQALHAFLNSEAEAVRNGLPAEQASSNGVHAENPGRGAGNAPPEENTAEQTTGAISRALFAWSNLPKFDTQAIPAQTPHAGASAPLPPALRSEADLLPARLAAILAGRDQQSMAQLGTPGWLANLAPSSTIPGLVPVDQQSTRTDLLVQRWLERWGRRPADQHASEEEQANEQ